MSDACLVFSDEGCYNEFYDMTAWMAERDAEMLADAAT